MAQLNKKDAAIDAAEYTAQEMKCMLDDASSTYDLVRVVDPIECRILEIGSDGFISRKERCYGIWSADQKCSNCTSALACRTGCPHEKKESFDGRVYHIQSNPVKLALPDGEAYDAVVELVNIEGQASFDTTANDRAAENVDHKADQYSARHDGLTKTLNPDAFSESSRELISENPSLSWVMITSNIMDFRLINTLFGSLRGNEVIFRTASALRQIAQDSRGLCGRLGGDQFAMLIPKSMYEEKALNNVAQTLADEFSSGLYTFRIHFGVYELDDSSIPVSVMCDRANSALRTIRKDLRESIAYFNDAMMQESLLAQEVISGFENALAQGQFQMYLQPLCLKDGSVIGAEALARWCRSDGTVTMPVDFIETLERAGLIHKLDVHIWECAVQQLAAWNGTPKQDLTISVNMSAQDFYHVDVYQTLTDLVKQYNVSCDKLKIEITETVLLEDPEIGSKVIAKLRQKGFLVEIDDFGKGYSSMSLLRDIAADVLKIDMSLLRDIETKERNRIIVESIANMATALGMSVVAEGVETETQLKLLVAMECRYFQGFYFSRPIPVDEFNARY